jgi:hypothetical protein
MAARIHVVSQRRAALPDGLIERFANRGNEIAQSQRTGPPGCAAGINASPKQSFAGIDITDANNDSLVHDERLDGYPATTRNAGKVVATEIGAQWLRTEASEQAMPFRITPRPQEAAEAARIVETQAFAGTQQKVVVIVHSRRDTGRNHPQAA